MLSRRQLQAFVGRRRRGCINGWDQRAELPYTTGYGQLLDNIHADSGRGHAVVRWRLL